MATDKSRNQKKPKSDSIITIGGGGGLLPSKKCKVKFKKSFFDFDVTNEECNSKNDIVFKRVKIACTSWNLDLPLDGDFELILED